MRPCSRYSYFVAASIHVAFALLGPQVSLAQEAATLKPVPHPKFPGVRVAVAQGSTDSKGQNFSVAGLAVSQPVIVYVSESTSARRVRVELADFDDFIVPLHTCQTTPAKACVFPTRTTGDLFVRVKSLDQEQAEYVVVVWAGEESKAALPSLFRPNRDAATARPDSPATSALPTRETGAAEQMTARFFAYDAGRKMLVVRDAVGATFEFVLPDEASLAVPGKVARVDEYLKAHFNNLPYAADQQLQIAWKPSASSKGRVVVAVR